MTETTTSDADNTAVLAILDDIDALATKALVYADRDQVGALGAKIRTLVEQAKAAL
jgi:hypothetical protein